MILETDYYLCQFINPRKSFFLQIPTSIRVWTFRLIFPTPSPPCPLHPQKLLATQQALKRHSLSWVPCPKEYLRFETPLMQKVEEELHVHLALMLTLISKLEKAAGEIVIGHCRSSRRQLLPNIHFSSAFLHCFTIPHSTLSPSCLV